MKIQFDVTVNLMEDNNLYYIGLWDSEGENYNNEEIDEIMLGYTWNEKDFTEIAAENNCINDQGETYFNEQDAEKVKSIIIKSLKETNSYKNLANIEYVQQ